MKKLLTICLMLASSAFCCSALAQTSIPQGHERQAFRLNVGTYSDYSRIELAYETKSLWQGRLFSRPIDLKLEAGLAYWRAHGHTDYGSRSNLWQLNLIPMLRWWVGDQWYIEGGIGATAMSHTRFADKEISTAFQFGDHIGIVHTFGEDWRLGLRLSHFSNASIKRPNSGLEIIQLTLSRNF